MRKNKFGIQLKEYLDFYNISNRKIEDHSIYEWMFIYDLLVHKHNMGRSSLTMLFDSEIDLTNANHIATQ